MGRQAQKRASRPRAPEGSHPPPRQQPYSADVTKRRYKVPDQFQPLLPMGHVLGQRAFRVISHRF
jgi:hypothetical protein